MLRLVKNRLTTTNLTTRLPVTNPNTMRSNMIDGPYTPTYTLADKVIFWLSGFTAGFIFAILMLGK
jgi:hypothetical protein